MQVEYKEGQCSIFHSRYDTVPNGRMSLKEFVTDFSLSKRDWIGRIRDCSDEDEQKKMKLRLPAITPAGIFTIRRADCLRVPSGFMSIDLDNLEGRTSKTKELIKDFPGLAYCGLSVRGNGVFCIIKIAHPDKYNEHLEAAFDGLKEMGLTPDPACKDICRLRFVSYDPDPIINFDTKPYEKLLPLPAINPSMTPSAYHNGAVAERVERCLAQIDSRHIDITKIYKDWISLAYALGNEFGEAGREYFHRVSRYYDNYNPKETDRTFTACLKGSAMTINSFFWLCKRNGIRW